MQKKSKKTPKIKPGKREQIKKNRYNHIRKKENLMFIGIILLVILPIITVFVSNDSFFDGTTKNSNTIKAKKIFVKSIYNDSLTDKHLISITNLYDQPAQCSIETFYDFPEKKMIGIIPSEATINWTVYGKKPQYTIDCEWKDVNVVGCIGSTFSICKEVRKNPELKNCLENEASYQPFCVGLITKNSSFCDQILLKKRRVHCHAYLEKKPELCDYLDRYREWCYFDIAVNRRKAELCDNISEPEKSVCLSIVLRNESLCPFIDGKKDSRCKSFSRYI